LPAYLYNMEKDICICGAGTMGRGIALAAASHGIRTLLYDLNPALLSSAAGLIEKELEQDYIKKRISAVEKRNISGLISFTGSLTDCRASFIIEAIIENKEAKSGLFLELAGFHSADTVFATNTSSLSITEIADLTPFPERIIGMHFFNPANRMKLVEVIRTKMVSEQIVKRTSAFAGQLGKTAVVCQDAPGFIVNHVARPFYLEALRLAEQGADIFTIDILMESAGFKMGPFHLMDLIGQDINYTVSRSLYEALDRAERLKPSGLQENLVKQGLLGKKSGRGFFEYSKPAAS
jgi:3-hydroxybutyryl-CoA dehydrogenase